MSEKGLSVGEAKIKVLNKNPFFGSLLFSLPVIETEDPKVCPTLGVDGEVMYVNTKYWASLERKEQYAVLMHEVGHLFLRHLWRGKKYQDVAIDPTTGQVILLYNLAGDFVINLMVEKDTRFQLPKHCCIDQKYEGWSTEDVYNDLKKRMQQATPQQMKDFMKHHQPNGCDKSSWGKGSPKEQREQKEKWNERTKQATEYSRQRGYEPEWLKRMWSDMQPKEDWRNILREYIQPFQNDYAFNPSDRRYLDHDFVLPDIQDGEKIDWIAIAIDTSGSIQGAELDSFIGEVKGILSAYDQVTARLTFCDAAASPFVELKDFDQDKENIKPTGGGGTAFEPVFDLIKKEGNNPLCLLYFTDGFGSFPNSVPEYDCLWITTTGEQVRFPFGHVLKYKI